MAKQAETQEERQQREVVEGIADNIAELARSVRSLLGGRLKAQTVVILLAHSTKLPQRQVQSVLDAVTNLERDYLKE